MATVNSAKDIIEGIRQAFFAQRIRETLLVHDAAKWITVHPNGKGVTNSGENAKGSPVLLDEETGEVLGGMGGKFTGMHISEAVSTVRTENSQHVIRRGQEQRKDPESFAKQQEQKMQEAEAAAAKAQEEAKAQAEAEKKKAEETKAKAGNAGGVSTASINPKLFETRVKDINKGKMKFTPEAMQLSDHVRSPELSKLSKQLEAAAKTKTGQWQTQSGVQFDNPELQNKFNHLEHQALVFRAMEKQAMMDNKPLPDSVVKNGLKLEKQCRELKKEWAQSVASDVGKETTMACDAVLDYARKNQERFANPDSISVGRELGMHIMGGQRAENISDWVDTLAAHRAQNFPFPYSESTSEHMDTFLKAKFAAAIMSGYKYAGKNSSEIQALTEQSKAALKKATDALLAYHNVSSVETAITHEYSLEKDKAKAVKAPKSVGGASKGAAMDFKAADNKSSNPNYPDDALKIIDPYTLKETWPYRVNCQSCVVAYEMRRRGYDVEAQPNMRGTVKQNGAFSLSQDTVSIWRNRETGAVPDFISLYSVEGLKEVIKPGARYSLQYTWEGKDKKSGPSAHILTVERVDGEIRIYDPQTGQIEDIKTHFNDSFTYSRIGCFRVDDCDIVGKQADSVLTQAGKGPMYNLGKKK